MKNLIHLPISQIRHNKSEVLMIRLNKTIIYENMGCLEYTVSSVSNSFGSYGMPKVYSDTNNYEQINYGMVELILHDGTITTDMDTPCHLIKKVKLWFKPSTYRISFEGSESHKYVVKTIESCDTSYLQNMKQMFLYCNALTTANTKDWDTSNVTNMSYVFFGCSYLTTLDLSNWNTEKVQTTSFMFYDCSRLQTVGDLGDWDTSQLSVVQWMFYNCYNLTELNLRNWDMTHVNDLSSMFDNCYNLVKINLSNWKLPILNTSYKHYMFDGCSALSEVRLDNCDNDTISKILSELPPANYGVIYCKEENAVGLEAPGNWTFNFDVGEENPEIPDVPEEPEEPEIPDVPYMEYSFINIDSETLNGMYTDKNTGATGCYGLPRVYTDSIYYSYYGYDDIELTLTNGSIAYPEQSALGSYSLSDISKVKMWFPKNTYSIKFSGKATSSSGITESNRINKLTYIDHNGDIADMSGMFKECSYLTNCVLNSNTGNVTNINNIFQHCNLLTTLDLSNLNTSNVTGMSYVFYGCSYLKTLDLSNFNTSNATSMQGMFHSCQNLTQLDLSNFDVSNVTNMSEMFNSCNGLQSLNLSNWNTNKVTDMRYMFQYCSNLIDLDLSSFDMTNVTSAANMFAYCTGLTNLQAPKNISKSISFSSCTNLTYDSLMSIINNLATVTSTQTLTLGSTNLKKLITAEKEIATNKGWTLA